MTVNKQIVTDNLQKIAGYLTNYGITTLEAQASFLALVGVYCNFIPKIKSCEYTSIEDIRTDYPKSFGKTDPSRISVWLFYESKNKGPVKDFYDYVYDVNNDGADVGNKYFDDGYIFADCGLLPIVGRGQFARYKQLVSERHKPALASAQALTANLAAATEVATLMFKERMQGVPASSHPQFFYEACRRFNNVVTDEASFKQAKLNYEHIYGSKLNESFGFNDKIAGNATSPYTYYGSDPRQSFYGYSDPNGKYPYNRTNGHSTINQLCKGDIRNSIVNLKENKRRIAIPVSDGTTWDEPHSAYAAQYPFNTVKETESGHFEEWDDTPGHERIHIYHRSGTYEEIDQRGTKVTRVVGDGYTIIDRNGFISIEGKANVTVAGNINIMCLSDANIDVQGSTKMTVGGSLDVGVANDFKLTCGGNISMWANGTLDLQSKKSIHMYTESSLYAHSEQDMHVTSDKQAIISPSKDLHLTSGSDVNLSSLNDVNIYSGKDMYTTSGGDMHSSCDGTYRSSVGGDRHSKTAGDLYDAVDGAVKQGYLGRWYLYCSSNINIYTDTGMYLESGFDTHIKTGGWLGTESGLGTSINGGYLVAIDAGLFMDLNGGLAAALPILGATKPEDIQGILGARFAKSSMFGTKAIQKGRTPPITGSARYPNIPPYISVEPVGETEFAYETEEDFKTTQAITSMLSTYANENGAKIIEGPIQQPFLSTIDEVVVPSNIAETLNVDPTAFTSNYKLSEHFTLGMMFDGGFNNKHRLRPQHGLTVNQIVANLSMLANNVLEKILPFLPGGISGYRKQWNITSGYRQGNSRSDHERGRACDIQIVGRNKKQHWEIAQQMQCCVAYDQLLLEYRGRNSVWIHVGYRDSSDRLQNVANRHHVRTMVDDRKYCDGLRLIAKV